MAHVAEAHVEPTVVKPYSMRVPPGVVAVTAIFISTAALIRLDVTPEAVVAAAFCAVLILLAAIDLEHGVIPNRIVLPAGALVVLGNIATQHDHAWQYVAASFLSFLVAFAISLATRGGVGMGDAKLSFLLGAGLGASVLGAFVIAGLAAGVVSITILVRHGMDARKQAIPFGPFLALGGILALLLS